MEEENKNAYSEVIEILKLVDDEKKLEALPMEMLEVLKSKANPEYKPLISKEIPLDEQNLAPETYSILSWIAMKYWNEENELIEDEKNNIIEKEENKKPESKQDENKDDENKEIIDNAHNMEIKNEDEENLLPVLHKELKWYEIIKNKIIELFKRIFKNKKTND